MKKPGNDILIWFWMALILPAAAAIIWFIDAQRTVEDGTAVNMLGLSPLATVAQGLNLIAGIFGIIVIHKALSMLRYLVHAR